MKYTVESLRQFGIQVAEKAGMSHQDAETLLKNLLFSDMRGVRSHGMTRLSGYVTRIERGCTSATAQPTITMDSGAVFSMDGNNGMGSTIGTAAMQACIRRAKEYGVSFCTVNHASHYGFGGFYAMQAAAEGMIGFNICNSPALVAPFGGATAMLGTNPLTVAVPSGKYPDLVLDMATSTVAKGKIALALKEGKSIPDNWALAPDGSPTTDPAVANKGALTPLGGAKGYALALIIDVICCCLCGGNNSRQIPRMFEDPKEPSGVGYFMGAIDIGGLGSGYTDLDPQSKINEMVGVNEYPAMVRTQQFTHPDTVLDELEKEDTIFHMGFFTSANAIANPCNLPQRWEKALDKLEFNVVMDIVMTPTAEAVCDLFLPVNTYAERDMYVATHYGACGTWIGAIKKAVTVGESKSDITIMRELGTRLRPELWEQYKTDIEYIDDQKLCTLKTPDGRPLTMQDLFDHGSYHVDYEYRKYEKGLLRPDGQPGFMTPTGRIELYSTMLEAWGDEPLPYYEEPPTSPRSTPEYAEEYPMVLSTGARTWSYFHSEQRQIEKLREIHPWPTVQVHPKTAEAYGICDGNWVWVENEYGKIEMKAQTTIAVPEAVVNVDHAWWFPERDPERLFDTFSSNANQLVPPEFGSTGFRANCKSLICRIYKVSEGER